MAPKVSLRPRAVDDLIHLHDHIAANAGLGVAGAYIDRSEEACRALVTFPLSGRAQDHVRPGLRTTAVDRRAVIVYLVRPRAIQVLRVLYRGHDLQAALRELSK
ncbi:MAG: type II toxin-antitoxin system RelE/ParE family toxin [Alphaproteobacteria bacterium]|nr:type II toxin-antitoxin system RelE/ParE family toxin [Alphaproteobacteria bacterium]